MLHQRSKCLAGLMCVAIVLLCLLNMKGKSISLLSKTKTSVAELSNQLIAPYRSVTQGRPEFTNRPPSIVNVTPAIQAEKPTQKYLIYKCDSLTYCYGTGDRQRAIVSLYIFALANNRKFGISWTSPANLRDFYSPNEIQWDIPLKELQFKTSIELQFYGPQKHIDYNIPFNLQYPQEVVYVRSNQFNIRKIATNTYYKSHLPEWAFRHPKLVFSSVWQKLVTPNDSIRGPLNKMLATISQDMTVDKNLRRHFQTGPCGKMCEYDVQGDVVAKKNQTQQSGGGLMGSCISYIKGKEKEILPEGYTSNYLPLLSKNFSLFCPRNNSEEFPIPPQDSIMKAKGFDVVDLNLVCVHVRIGKTKHMPRDPVRNSVNSTSGIWDFLQPLVEAGRHIYLASDSDEVKTNVKKVFGPRAHTGEGPITHSAFKYKSVDEWEGQRLAFWEQLLMMTSCRTLVTSRSGFSLWAAAVAEQLMPGKLEKHVFYEGKVH